MMGHSVRAQDLKPVLISDFGIGPVVHIKEYRARWKRPVPLCRVNSWQDIDWQVDIDKGDFAKPCLRCQKMWEKLRAEALKKQKAADKRKNAKKRATPEARALNSARAKIYYQETKRIALKKERIRYWKNLEKARARNRKKYQQNREAILIQSREHYNKNRDQINARRRELRRQRKEEQGN